MSRNARCGADHTNLSFAPLINPADDFEYWVFCPVMHQPLWLSVRSEGRAPEVA